MGARRKKSKKPSGTKAEQLLEQTTFFADYCLGREAGEMLRQGGWRVEFHLDHFAENEPDESWIPEVCARGWVMLTKDKGIRRKSWERDKVISAKGRLFTLSSGNMTGAEMGEAFFANRFRMARILLKAAAPFIALVNRNSVSLLWPEEASAAEESAE